MKRTFKTEDRRKDKLWIAWNEHLAAIAKKFSPDGEEFIFGKVYEGLAKIQSISENTMKLKVPNGEKACFIPITKDIMESSCIKDDIYIVIGKYQNRWWPLEVATIASFVNFKTGEFHFSINPEITKEYNRKAMETSPMASGLPH